MPRTEKPSRGAVWLLVIVAVLIAILVSTSKMKQVTPVAEVSQDSQMLCYYSSTPTASGFNDVYSLKLSTDGTTVTGELATAPAEKDKMNGTLDGVLISNGEEVLFSGTYANSAEGMDTIDQKMIKLTENNAMIGYGEMKLEADGSYSYANPDQIDYSLSLPRVDCASYTSAF